MLYFINKPHPILSLVIFYETSFRFRYDRYTNAYRRYSVRGCRNIDMRKKRENQIDLVEITRASYLKSNPKEIWRTRGILQEKEIRYNLSYLK